MSRPCGALVFVTENPKRLKFWQEIPFNDSRCTHLHTRFTNEVSTVLPYPIHKHPKRCVRWDAAQITWKVLPEDHKHMRIFGRTFSSFIVCPMNSRTSTGLELLLKLPIKNTGYLDFTTPPRNVRNHRVESLVSERPSSGICNLMISWMSVRWSS